MKPIILYTKLILKIHLNIWVTLGLCSLGFVSIETSFSWSSVHQLKFTLDIMTVVFMTLNSQASKKRLSRPLDAQNTFLSRSSPYSSLVGSTLAGHSGFPKWKGSGVSRTCGQKASWWHLLSSLSPLANSNSGCPELCPLSCSGQ